MRVASPPKNCLLCQLAFCENKKKKLHVDVKQNNKYTGYLKELPIVTILAFCF